MHVAYYGPIRLNHAYRCPVPVSCEAGHSLCGKYCVADGSTFMEAFDGEPDVARAVVSLDDGSMVIAGGATVSQPSPSLAGMLVHVDDEGGVLFEETYTGGSVFNDVVHVGSGGFAAAGNAGVDQNQMWLARIDAGGATLWQQTYDAAGVDVQQARALAEVPTGGFVLVGVRDSSQLDAARPHVLRADDTGQLSWTRTLGDGALGGLDAVVALDDGTLAVAGYRRGDGSKTYPYLGRLDASGNPISEHFYSESTHGRIFDMVALANGFVLAGESYGFAHIIRTHPTGFTAWEQTYAVGAVQSGAMSIAVTESGAFAIAGFDSAAATSRDLYMMTIEDAPSGPVLWEKVWDAGGSELLNGVAVIPDGRVCGAGNASDEGGSVFVVCTSVDGEICAAE